MIALTLVVLVLTGHTVVNAWLLRQPRFRPVSPRVAVLLPVRDEAHRLTPCLRALLAQTGASELRILVLDDGSTDGTAELVRSTVDGDRRVTLITGAPLPAGWLGKPHACQQLAAAAGAAEVLLFLDADVVLEPTAVAATVALLEDARVDLLCPYPKIIARTLGERLIQPLLQWSWLTLVPLRAMERSRNPALSAIGGQLFAIRRDAYFAAGGHAAVRDKVLEDVELARAVKRSGGRIALADGSRIARCRMYTSWNELVAGYSKSLWASPGVVFGAVLFLVLYLVPVFWWTWAGLAAYLLGVAGRVVSARRTGGRAFPDALAHPVSVVLFAWLVARSYRHRRSTTWKGRVTWPTSR
jgi:cellulose synthase/poly-beta-1,6-N-acetylglucosamine synthase-like glycosyltransferase